MSINANVITSRFNSKKIIEFCKRNVYLWLAFCIPLALMLTAFALMNVSPFGTAEKQVMVTDQWHQYYPFLADFQNKLQHGESLFWTWSVGSGVNYFSLMSYYVASPMNLLSFFVSPDYLREFLMISISVKIAFAGCFMALFLRSVFKRNDMSIVFFGICFSFCAYFMGYYWNNIWLDTVAITPLVALSCPISLFYLGYSDVWVEVMAVAAAALVIVRHYPNFVKLVHGTESKFSLSSKH